MKNTSQSNIAVKPNIWCDPVQADLNDVPYFLQEIIPGDLLVHFLDTRDVRTTRSQLTHRQHVEFEQSRFFQNHGQTGLAFEDRTGDMQTPRA
jgi:hypothetical protein